MAKFWQEASSRPSRWVSPNRTYEESLSFFLQEGAAKLARKPHIVPLAAHLPDFFWLINPVVRGILKTRTYSNLDPCFLKLNFGERFGTKGMWSREESLMLALRFFSIMEHHNL